MQAKLHASTLNGTVPVALISKLNVTTALTHGFEFIQFQVNTYIWSGVEGGRTTNHIFMVWKRKGK
jgi:hypothetical protein